MATLGGASVLNLESKIGNFELGKSLDAILIDLDASRPIHTFDHDTLADKFEKFIYLGDDRHMLEIFVNGNAILNKGF
jgi:guanine deaminase